MSNQSQLISISTETLDTKIEFQWLNSGLSNTPLLVFLHEGLGSLSMWKEFPQQLCDAIKCRGLVYSRPANGQSVLRPGDEKRGINYMHQHAYEFLPSLLSALEIDTKNNPPWLFGHSDGGSITLLYASKFPKKISGAIVLAPHILVEPLTISSIELARKNYETTNLREKLSKHHDDVDSAFWGWNNIWLDPEFLQWNIEDELESIRCPLLAVQGLDDEYGTMNQIRGIKRKLPHTKLLELSDCGHSPHRDQAETLVMAATRFIHNNTLEENTYEYL